MPGFTPGTVSYAVGVGNADATATVAATASASTATITIAGASVTSGSAHTVNLAEGVNTFSIVVTNGTDTQTYTLRIVRRVDFGWTVVDDIENLVAASMFVRDIWSDGITMWLADSAAHTLYAYTLATGARVADRDITASDNSLGAGSIWTDGETMWVMTPSINRAHAYVLATGADDDSKDVTLSGGQANGATHSDGVTVWVANPSGDTLDAYQLNGSRDESRSVTLVVENDNAWGLWSDGETMWVADRVDDKLYAYNMPVSAYLKSLTVDPMDITGFSSSTETYAVDVAAGVAVVTVAADPVQSRAAVVITPADADGDDANGHQVNVAAGATTAISFAVTNGSASKTYTVNVTRPASISSNNQPAFPSSETGARAVAEGTPAGENIGAAVAATDDDGDTLTYTLGGTDAAAFDIVETSGQLQAKAALDYETKSSYAVTVSVRDSKDGSGDTDTDTDDMIEVTITVTNADEAGTVSVSALPTVGTAVTATLTDPDGAVSGVTWRWEKSTSVSGPWTAVTGATGNGATSSYTPVAADTGNYLRATASYTDPLDSGKNAAGISALIAGTDPSLTPSPDDPEVAIRSKAVYRVDFTSEWTTSVTPDGVPNTAHFTTLIGGVHNDAVTFLEAGGTATAGVAAMAERGTTTTLAAEVNAAGTDSLSVLQSAGGLGADDTETIQMVTLTTDHPRVTLLTMIAPSPDWFVGVSGLSLLDADGNWLASHEVKLYPWDAGTAEGEGFGLSTTKTIPQETITSLRGKGKFSNRRIATLTFTRQSVNTAPSFTSMASFQADENQTAAATVAAADPDSVDGVSYAITGGADALKFDIGETTGVLTFKVPPNYESAADVASTDPLNEAGNNEYVVTVTATGGTADRALTAEHTITVSVRNLEEAGTVSFSQIGSAIRATLSDPDGGVNSRSWQWASLRTAARAGRISAALPRPAIRRPATIKKCTCEPQRPTTTRRVPASRRRG